ncbi:MAG: hypothetical protein ACO1N5_15865, partial [Noviherbaspirillum sp.]
TQGGSRDGCRSKKNPVQFQQVAGNDLHPVIRFGQHRSDCVGTGHHSVKSLIARLAPPGSRIPFSSFLSESLDAPQEQDDTSPHAGGQAGKRLKFVQLQAKAFLLTAKFGRMIGKLGHGVSFSWAICSRCIYRNFWLPLDHKII